MALIKFIFIMLLFLCIYGAIYNFACVIFRLPDKKITKTLRRASVNRTGASGSDINHTLAELLSKFVYINEYKKNEIKEKLSIAEIDESPELYIAQGILLLLECLISALLVIVIVQIVGLSPIISFICVIPAIVMGIYLFTRHKNILRYAVADLQEQMDIDLPRFVYAVTQDMLVTHDVVFIMERHKNDYSDVWKHQMDITIADMKSGNYETALLRLEGRVGSANLSEVVRGLIEMTKGNDTKVYWETLQVRFSEMRKQELRKQVKRLPDKVHNLSLWLILAMIAIYSTVFITVMFDSISAFSI